MARGTSLAVAGARSDDSDTCQDGLFAPANTEALKELTESSGITVTGCNNSSDDKIPPMDGGVAAWKFLAGAFVMEALQWG